jgi:hypothetical protein
MTTMTIASASAALNLEHPLLVDLDRARVASEAAWAASEATWAAGGSKAQCKANTAARRAADDAYEQAKRNLKAGGGRFYDTISVKDGFFRQIGVSPGGEELFNPHGDPEERIRAALAIKAGDEARAAELAGPNAEVAAAFRAAFGDKTRSWSAGDAKVHRDGSIACRTDRDPAEARAEIKHQIEEAGERQRKKRSQAAKKSADDLGDRRRPDVRRLREINLVAEGYLASGVWTPASKCRCCHRDLTDPVSRERGIGPECFDRILKVIEAARTTGRPVCHPVWPQPPHIEQQPSP